MTAQPPVREHMITTEVSPTGQGPIVLDGHDVSRVVRGFTIKAHVGEVTRMELDVTPPWLVAFNAMARIEITPELRAIMLAAGWTPPVEDAS
jgi:hypothetical protein